MADKILSTKVSEELAAKFDDALEGKSRASVLKKFVEQYIEDNDILIPKEYDIVIPLEKTTIQYPVNVKNPVDTIIDPSINVQNFVICEHPKPWANLATGTYCPFCKTKMD